MGQARAVVVALMVDKDLRLVFKPSEGAGMDYALAVALEIRAVGMRLFAVFPSPGAA